MSKFIPTLPLSGLKSIEYKPFKWTVSPHKIDPYLTYRLIEPGYEVWNKIQLRERGLESFTERIIADNNLTENTCMNCHIPSGNNPDLSFFHNRGNNGCLLYKFDAADDTK